MITILIYSWYLKLKMGNSLNEWKILPADEKMKQAEKVWEGMSTFNACQHIIWNMLTLYGVTFSPSITRNMLRTHWCEPTRPEFLRHRRIDRGAWGELPLPHEPPYWLCTRLPTRIGRHKMRHVDHGTHFGHGKCWHLADLTLREQKSIGKASSKRPAERQWYGIPARQCYKSHTFSGPG